jgi:amino acid transporter
VVGQGVSGLNEALAALADPTTFVFTLAERYANSALSEVMGILFATSLFAALLAFHNNSARYFYALGRERLLPGVLGRTHAEHQSPHMGSLLQSLLAACVLAAFALAGGDPVLNLFTWGANLATLGVTALMAMTSFSVVAFFQRHPGLEPSRMNTMIAPLISGIVLTITTVLVARNFTVLTGAQIGLAIVLVAILPGAGAIGLARAHWLKLRQSADFARLGADRLT